VTPTAVTPTSLRAVVPVGAVTGRVSIANSIGTTTSAASFKVLPRITEWTPQAELGSTVVVNGTNLKTGGATPIVKVGTVAAVVVDSSPTEVTFTVPALAVTGNITITTADGTATSPTALTVLPGSIGF
jgi:sugar phosphate permease